ncbi:MAG: hypothetical protein AAF388_06860 [Bacteroidota bacterium]
MKRGLLPILLILLYFPGFSQKRTSEAKHFLLPFFFSITDSNAFQKGQYLLNHIPEPKSKIDFTPEINSLFNWQNGDWISFVNNSNKELRIWTADNSSLSIREKLTTNGSWKPIEYLIFGGCGNSYKELTIPPYSIALIYVPRYLSGRMTTVRHKLYAGNQIYYSSPITRIIPHNVFIPLSKRKGINILNDLPFQDK